MAFHGDVLLLRLSSELNYTGVHPGAGHLRVTSMQGGEPSHIPQPHPTGFLCGLPVDRIATLRAACPKVVLSLPPRMRMLRPLVPVQNIRALEAVPCEDGKASAVSDSGILLNWTESKGGRAAEVARALFVSVALYPFFTRSMEAAANRKALLA